MTLPVLMDMNLSPAWVPWFEGHHWPAVHWSTIGDRKATDQTIMAWARAHGHIIFTHDLDFGTLLALTNASGPSVVQVRAQDVLPQHIGRYVLAALKQYSALFESGVLVVVNEKTARARILPLRRQIE
jgi:predicted nuclease of predicted toxin-antitoxin system